MNSCNLCGLTNIEVIPASTSHKVHWKCERCGEVIITDVAADSLSKYSSILWKLSAICRRRTRQGLPPIELNYDNLVDISKNVKQPSTVLEAQDRVIHFFAKESDLRGSWIRYDYNSHLDVMIKDTKEMSFVLRLLNEQGYLDFRMSGEDEMILNQPDKQPASFEKFMHQESSLDVRLTGKGWAKYDEIIRPSTVSDKAFIAMWFSQQTRKLREALKVGIEAAGYDPIIADEEDYTGNIMDFVLASIRRSKFIVADFTAMPEKIEGYKNVDGNKIDHIKGGVRGGVYYEAGFAKGLNIEVIHTCKDDSESKSRLHFDVAQENTIFWSDKEIEHTTVRKITMRKDNIEPINLSEKLYDRIIGLFGPGPLENLQ